MNVIYIYIYMSCNRYWRTLTSESDGSIGVGSSLYSGGNLRSRRSTFFGPLQRCPGCLLWSGCLAGGRSLRFRSLKETKGLNGLIRWNPNNIKKMENSISAYNPMANGFVSFSPNVLPHWWFNGTCLHTFWVFPSTTCLITGGHAGFTAPFSFFHGNPLNPLETSMDLMW